MFISQFQIVFKCSNYIQMFEFILHMAFQELACCRWRRLQWCGSWYPRNCSKKWNPFLDGIEPGQATDNNDMFCLLSIILCCWYLDEKKNIWKRKEISLLLLISFLNPKISFFIRKAGGEGGGCLCWAWRNTRGYKREQTWQSVMVRGRCVKKGNFSVTILLNRPKFPWKAPLLEPLLVKLHLKRYLPPRVFSWKCSKIFQNS